MPRMSRADSGWCSIGCTCERRVGIEVSMGYESIIYSSDDGIARITLNRPDRLNSFTTSMHAELRDALSQVASDPSARALLLTGAGRGFCAGQDLSDRAVAPGSAAVDLGES